MRSLRSARSRIHLALCTALFATCALAAAPRAALAAPPTQFDDARFDLHLTLASEDANVCVMFPAGRDDPAACEGIDLAKTRKALAPQIDKLVATAVLRFPGWAVMATVIQVPGPPTPWEKANKDSFVRGVANELPRGFPGATLHGSTPGATYDAVDLHGHPAVRYFVEAPIAQGDPRYMTSRQVGYGLPADGATLMVTFMTDPAHDTELRRIAERTMDSLQVRAPKAVPSEDFQRGELMGRLAVQLLTGLFFLGGLVWIVVRLVKKK